jgi:hypothetical protein
VANRTSFPFDGPRATAPVPLRFEDVTQDGRLVLESLPNALGPTFWRGMILTDGVARRFREGGVLPIITRFVLEGTPGPFSSNAPFEAEGTYRIARSEDGRFMLDMYAELYAPVGRTYERTPNEGERAVAGRVTAEHVFTRPFAAPGERRVTSLDFPGAPEVRETRPAPPAPASIATLPPGATPLDPAPRADPVPFPFGLVHTDGNMHVNSLAYLRLFEEAALRRLVALGRGAAVLGRTMDIAYRRPCFAGQTVCVVQAFEADGKLGIAAVLVDEADARDEASLARARPYTFARMTFEP